MLFCVSFLFLLMFIYCCSDLFRHYIPYVINIDQSILFKDVEEYWIIINPNLSCFKVRYDRRGLFQKKVSCLYVLYVFQGAVAICFLKVIGKLLDNSFSLNSEQTIPIKVLRGEQTGHVHINTC